MKKIIGFSIIFIIILGTGIFAYQSFSSNEGITWSLGDLTENALVKNPEISCTVKQTTHIIDSVGRDIKVDTSPSFTDSPTLALTATTSNNPIAGSSTDILLSCSSTTNPSMVALPSTLTLIVQGEKTQGGSSQVLVSKSITTQKVDLPKGSTKSIGYISVYGRDIESAIGSSVKFDSHLVFKVSGNIKIAYKGYENLKSYTLPISSGKLPTYYTARVSPDFKPSDTTVKTIDTDGDGIIDIYDKCPSQKETFNGYQDTDGCPDTGSTQPSPSPTDEKPVTPTTCPTGQTWVKDHCETPKTADSQKGTVYLKYKMILQNRILQNDITKTGGIGIDFTPLSFVNVKGERFLSFFAEPVMKLDGVASDYSATVGGLKYGAQIQYGDVAYDLKNFVGTTTSRIIKDSDGYYHFPPFEIPSDMIEKTFEGIADRNKNSENPFKLRLAISGDFVLTRQSDNKQFKAVVQDVGMYLDMTYDPSIVSGTQELCQGMNGEELLKCKQTLCEEQGDCLPPSAGGGYCDNVKTSLDCIDNYKDCQNNGKCASPTGDTSGGSKINTKGEPKIDLGTINICPDTSTFQECASEIINKTTGGSSPIPSLDTNTILILAGILIFIIIIIAIAKRKRK